MTNQQKEQLRAAVLVYLVERHPLSFEGPVIHRMLLRHRMVDFTVTETDTDSAIAMLAASNLISGPSTPNRLGSSIPYTASPEGLLYAETEGLL